MMQNKSSQEHINVKERTKHEQIHTSWLQYKTVAETFVAVICSQLSNIPSIFRNCDHLVLNKSLEKENCKLRITLLQIKIEE